MGPSIKAQKIYELANAKRDEKNYTAAIYYYHQVLALMPSNTEAQKNMKEIWNKRIAENRNLYPAPFAGEWEYVYAQPQYNVPTQVVDATASSALGGTQYKTEYRTIPGKSIVIKFDNSSNYTFDERSFSGEGQNFKRLDEGTFFYTNGDHLDMGDGEDYSISGFTAIIELEGGMILGFDGQTLYFPYGKDLTMTAMKRK
jgi:hypothetical protein